MANPSYGLLSQEFAQRGRLATDRTVLGYDQMTMGAMQGIGETPARMKDMQQREMLANSKVLTDEVRRQESVQRMGLIDMAHNAKLNALTIKQQEQALAFGDIDLQLRKDAIGKEGRQNRLAMWADQPLRRFQKDGTRIMNLDTGQWGDSTPADLERYKGYLKDQALERGAKAADTRATGSRSDYYEAQAALAGARAGAGGYAPRSSGATTPYHRALIDERKTLLSPTDRHGRPRPRTPEEQDRMDEIDQELQGGQDPGGNGAAAASPVAPGDPQALGSLSNTTRAVAMTYGIPEGQLKERIDAMLDNPANADAIQQEGGRAAAYRRILWSVMPGMNGGPPRDAKMLQALMK